MQAQTGDGILREAEHDQQQFLYAIVIVAVIMAVGGVFGVMNTMFAAISQRTKDIGVLRIIGFARWQILMSFFLESLVLALIGGLLGCALGSLANGCRRPAHHRRRGRRQERDAEAGGGRPNPGGGDGLFAADGLRRRPDAGAVGDAAQAAGAVR